MRVKSEKNNGEGNFCSKFLVRLTGEDMSKLNYSSDILGVSKSEILRKGLETQYQLARLKG